MSAIPEPGTYVCISEMIGGHRDSYRAQVLSADHDANSSLAVQVFAVDNGFTKTVSANCLYILPENLLGIPPQVCIFNNTNTLSKITIIVTPQVTKAYYKSCMDLKLSVL